LELNFPANKSVRKFARLHGEWTYIAGQLFRFFVNPFSEDHLEDTIAGFAKRTKDQRHEMGINRDWRKRGSGKGEINSGDIDP